MLRRSASRRTGNGSISTIGLRIRKVRQVYRGRITYSANWDHLDPVTFGGELDFLGMNAYYEVGKGGASDAGSMVARWKEIQEGIRDWWEANGRKKLVMIVTS